jgi:hypothetical protein
VKALSLVVLLALAYVPHAYAAEDAPLATLEQPLKDRCLDAAERANVVKRDEKQKAYIAELEKNVGTPVPVVITLVSVSVAVALAGGIAIGFAAKK